MATVRPGVLELAAPSEAKQAEIQTVRVEVSPPKSRLIKAHSTLDPTIVPLEGAEVVVGIGTGVGGPEGVAKVAAFARVLGAAMCATRRVTDQGWVPRQLQVGLTGKSIDPRLYIAVGVRGAPNHTCGLKRAQTVSRDQQRRRRADLRAREYRAGRRLADHPARAAGRLSAPARVIVYARIS